MKTEPLRLVLIPVILAAVGAAVEAFAAGATTRGIVSAALAALVLAGQELARRYVTPTGKGEAGQSVTELLIVLTCVLVVLIAVGVLPR